MGLQIIFQCYAGKLCSYIIKAISFLSLHIPYVPLMPNGIFLY